MNYGPLQEMISRKLETKSYIPDQRDIVYDVSLQGTYDIWYVHILRILGHVRPHRSHDSKLDKKEIQSTVVPVLAFCNKVILKYSFRPLISTKPRKHHYSFDTIEIKIFQHQQLKDLF